MVAAFAAVFIIGSWIVAQFLNGLGTISGIPAQLDQAAYIAIGAVFGSAVAVNGWKQPMESAHSRIDKIESAVGISTH